jgi:hypothetical protein
MKSRPVCADLGKLKRQPPESRAQARKRSDGNVDPWRYDPADEEPSPLFPFMDALSAGMVCPGPAVEVGDA